MPASSTTNSYYNSIVLLDPKCLTVNLIHNVQRATEGKAAGRTFSTGHCFGKRGVSFNTAPLPALGQGLLERKSGAERLEGNRAARFTQRSETRRRQHSAPRVLPRSVRRPGKGGRAPRRSLRAARGGGAGRGLGWLGRGRHQSSLPAA